MEPVTNIPEGTEANACEETTPGKRLYSRLKIAMESRGCPFDEYQGLDPRSWNALEEVALMYTPQEGKPTTFDLQREVMTRSAQDLPAEICLTPQTIMYAALNLEELGEQLVALAEGINHGAMGPTDGSRMYEGEGWSQAANLMGHVGADIQQQSRDLRNSVKDTFRGTNPRIAITLPYAKEIVDGANDVTVVNAGFLLSMGVPAMACYEEVTLSNLSKANPETGVIDKELDGKWIKGVNYKAPDLGRIIEPLLWKIPA